MTSPPSWGPGHTLTTQGICCLMQNQSASQQAQTNMLNPSSFFLSNWCFLIVLAPARSCRSPTGLPARLPALEPGFCAAAAAAAAGQEQPRAAPGSADPPGSQASCTRVPLAAGPEPRPEWPHAPSQPGSDSGGAWPDTVRRCLVRALPTQLSSLSPRPELAGPHGAGLRCLLAAKALPSGDAVCGEQRHGERWEETSLLCAELPCVEVKNCPCLCNEPWAPVESRVQTKSIWHWLMGSWEPFLAGKVAVPPPRRNDTALTQGTWVSSCHCHGLLQDPEQFVCVPVVVKSALSCLGGDQRGCSWVPTCPLCLPGSAIPDMIPCCPLQHLSMVWVLAVLEGPCGAVGPAEALTCQAGAWSERNASGFHSRSKTVPKEVLRRARIAGTQAWEPWMVGWDKVLCPGEPS